MRNISHAHVDCISLQGEKILRRFRDGRFPDKTFSKLYAKQVGVLTLPGIVMEVRQEKVGTCYRITCENDDFPLHSDIYCVQYDFRAQFTNIEQWMETKKVRPGPVSCSKETLERQLERSLEKGCNFAMDFFLIATISFPAYPLILSTLSGQSTFIEYSENFGVVHGSKNAELCILQGETAVRNEPSLPYDILMEAARVTREFTELIGRNTTCEFFLLDDVLCLLAAQKRSIKRMHLSVCCSEEVKTIAPGPLQGTVKQVDKRSLPEVVTALSETNQHYVFIAEKPYSEFLALLNYAKGFIFNQGSMLCHLAILLREKGIPARIINESTSKYKDGDTLMLE